MLFLLVRDITDPGLRNGNIEDLIVQSKGEILNEKFDGRSIL